MKRRLPIEYIDDDDNRKELFYKRMNGIMKKLYDIHDKTGCSCFVLLTGNNIDGKRIVYHLGFGGLSKMLGDTCGVKDKLMEILKEESEKAGEASLFELQKDDQIGLTEEQNGKSRIVFDVLKAGLMMKGYQITVLAGVQALLLLAMEDGFVFSFATPYLQPFLQNEEVKKQIRAYLANPSNVNRSTPPGPDKIISNMTDQLSTYFQSSTDNKKIKLRILDKLKVVINDRLYGIETDLKNVTNSDNDNEDATNSDNKNNNEEGATNNDKNNENKA